MKLRSIILMVILLNFVSCGGSKKKKNNPKPTDNQTAQEATPEKPAAPGAAEEDTKEGKGDTAPEELKVETKSPTDKKDSEVVYEPVSRYADLDEIRLVGKEQTPLNVAEAILIRDSDTPDKVELQMKTDKMHVKIHETYGQFLIRMAIRSRTCGEYEKNLEEFAKQFKVNIHTYYYDYKKGKSSEFFEENAKCKCTRITEKGRIYFTQMVSEQIAAGNCPDRTIDFLTCMDPSGERDIKRDVIKINFKKARKLGYSEQEKYKVVISQPNKGKKRLDFKLTLVDATYTDVENLHNVYTIKNGGLFKSNDSVKVKDAKLLP